MPMNIGPMEVLVLLVVVIIIAGAVAVALRLGIKGPAAASDTPPPAASAADELGKLDALHQRGVLTDDEFESQKRALLVR